MTTLEEYEFWRKEFEAGFSCSYGDNKEELVRVFKDKNKLGINVRINRELVASLPSGEILMGVLVRSMSESFATTFYKTWGYLPSVNSEIDTSDVVKQE